MICNLNNFIYSTDAPVERNLNKTTSVNVLKLTKGNTLNHTYLPRAYAYNRENDYLFRIITYNKGLLLSGQFWISHKYWQIANCQQGSKRPVSGNSVQSKLLRGENISRKQNRNFTDLTATYLL